MINFFVVPSSTSEDNTEICENTDINSNECIIEGLEYSINEEELLPLVSPVPPARHYILKEADFSDIISLIFHLESLGVLLFNTLELIFLCILIS